MAEGMWPEVVAAVGDLRDQVARVQRAGAGSERACEQAVDRLAGLGIVPLTARGQAAFGAVQEAQAALAQVWQLWEQAVAAVCAVDPASAGHSGGVAAGGTGAGVAGGGGGVLLPGTVGDRLVVSDRGTGDGDGGSGGSGGGVGSGGAVDGGQWVVVPFGWESGWGKVREGLWGTSVPVGGKGEEWGLTKADLYRDMQGAGAVLVHVDRDSTTGFDPVNDPYWGRLVGPDGQVLEAGVLPNLRDEFARPEGVYEPTSAEKSRAGAARFTTGSAEQVLTGALPGVIGSVAGHVWGPAKDAATRKLAGRENDPTAPRKMVFSRAFSRMNMTQLELVRADVPRAAREDARHAQYVELERQAHRLGVSEQRLDDARAAVADLPAYPRPQRHRHKKKGCRQAIQMHHREGREFLAVELLIGDRDGE